MPIYLPRTIEQLSPTLSEPLLFLAGPIRGGGDWQALMAQEILARAPHAHIACPSRWNAQHPLAYHFHQPYSYASNRQLEWERHFLKQAGLEPDVPGCILFWLGLESATHPHPGPEPFAMDTRREIGKFTAFAEMMDVRMVVGGDHRFHGLDVILFELSKAVGKPFPFYETMAEAACSAVSIATSAHKRRDT